MAISIIAAMLIGVVALGMPYAATTAPPAGIPQSGSDPWPLGGGTFGPTAPAAIFTQIAYSGEADGMLIVYHVLRPGPYFTSDETGVVYKFTDNTGKGCTKFKPVFRADEVLFDNSLTFAERIAAGATGANAFKQGDRARRSVFEASFNGPCPEEKAVRKSLRSEEAIIAAGPPPLGTGLLDIFDTGNFVNAPSVPSPEIKPDWALWEAPPNGHNLFDGSIGTQSLLDNQELKDIVMNSEGDVEGLTQMVRPRHKGFAGGKAMWYITYETCSGAPWLETGFCQGDGVKPILFVRYDPTMGVLGQTNVAAGVPFPIDASPRPESASEYSPIWRGECVGGLWTEDRGFPGTNVSVGPPTPGDGIGRAGCFGPTPAEVNAYTSEHGITLPGDDRIAEQFGPDDDRIGSQIRHPDAFALLAPTETLPGMNGFTAATAPFAGPFKIINCPIFASDLNGDRRISADEFIAFPNFVLQANSEGDFEVINQGGPAGE